MKSLKMSATLQNGISEIYTDLEKLSTASKATQATMGEVANGASDTADAVQNQLEQTEVIHQKVTLVDDASSEISEVCQRPLKFFHREVLILNSLLKLLTYL